MTGADMCKWHCPMRFISHSVRKPTHTVYSNLHCFFIKINPGILSATL